MRKITKRWDGDYLVREITMDWYTGIATLNINGRVITLQTKDGRLAGYCEERGREAALWRIKEDIKHYACGRYSDEAWDIEIKCEIETHELSRIHCSRMIICSGSFGESYYKPILITPEHGA